MKTPCSIIKDLLPLYAEGMASEETGAYVEEHLAGCESCKKELEQIGRTDIMAPNSGIVPLKKIKTALQRKRAAAVAFAVVLTLTVALLCVGYMLAPQAVPYDNEMFRFTTDENDVVSVCINRPVSSWDLEYMSSEERGGKVCYLSAWTNNLFKLRGAEVPSKSAVIKEKSEKLAGVYYSPNDGTENILIYGAGAPDNGGSITLPRLTLAYYALIAAMLAALIGIAIGINRKNKPAKYLLFRIGYVPCSYLFAHFLVKGFDARTYVMMHDLCAILIIAIPVYGLCLLAERLIIRNTD